MTTTKSRSPRPPTKKTAVAPPPSPDTASIAAQIAALLDQIQALIPDYEPADASRRRQLAANAKFAPELLVPTISAVTNYDRLREMNMFNVDAARKALRARDDLGPVAQRIAIVADALDYIVKKMLAASAIEALQTYDWSRRHIRYPENAGLNPYVDKMAEVIAKTINRRPKTQTAPAPPAPQGFIAGAADEEGDDVAHLIEELGKLNE